MSGWEKAMTRGHGEEEGMKCPTEKFKQHGGWDAKGTVIECPALPGKEPIPSPRVTAEKEH